MVTDFNSAIHRAAIETIPRGARKNCRPYWTKELQDLEDQVNAARKKVENEPSEDNNINLKATTAKYRKAFIESARNNWQKKTKQLNFDRGGKKQTLEPNPCHE